MAKHKNRKQRGARAGCFLCRPRKAHGAPPDSKFRVGELRRLGGAKRRVTKRLTVAEFQEQLEVDR